MIKKFLDPEGHQNAIGGSKVLAILLKGWIMTFGGASWGEGLHLQPAQQAGFYTYIDIKAKKINALGPQFFNNTP